MGLKNVTIIYDANLIKNAVKS